ncbi:sigma-70 family RNA polymerase sigma factor [Aquisalimonas lutea]|uniref:RNA polymerase sigma factor n=1 Tax=Aquisalimonas lutea TaxID=1327750 RepID=UPI0025B30087|nr:sigma-70 family RNA polymerase sigma factor [Aquisalimonas lutea]MDN3518487.1 sigma-70 family RNA polymerase sigma factor [Aquisalimonas lutea]
MTRLFENERRSLISRVRRIVSNDAVAEELVQESFLRLLDRPFMEHSAALLHRTARNLALDYLRSKKVRDRRPQGLREMDEGILPPTDHVVEMADEWQQLIEVLEQLPERTRQIFLLNRVDGETYAAIAGMLGISTSAVEKHMMRAMKACRDWQRGRGTD